MSTDLKSHASKVSLTRFSGGSRGTCVQVTTPASPDTKAAGAFASTAMSSSLVLADYIQLTRGQAAALAADLLDFAQGRESVTMKGRKL
tara:strand:- start:351 stop:617 length:267 start_codon:yes stop_codon:yes gene_type:complete